MANTVTVDQKTLTTILSRLEELTREVRELKAKLFESEPRYGSDEWWEKEIKEAEEDFKKGNYASFDNAEEAIKWLNS